MTALRPLSGVRVLDLSTLLPGPLATLLLAESGAEVIKIERPGRGDEMRTYQPRLGGTSANYAVLNRGKRAYAADLKNVAERDRVLALAAKADVVVEQFRPGVTDRLGLGYDQVRAANPGVIYCSITGYGQHGPNAARAGHDLNYLAEMGLLGVVADGTGTPPLPPTVLADIAAGTYPAVMNILLALRQRDATGAGCHLDVSITHNLQLLAYGYFATHQGGGGWPVPGQELLTGGSPRYQVYGTSDGRHVAVAALEDKFWERLATLVDLPTEYLDERGREKEIIAEMTRRIGAHTAEHWRTVFDGEDICAVVVATFDEAVESGLVDTDSTDRLIGEGFDVGTLPSPVDSALRRPPGALGYPALDPLPTGAVWSPR
ncbi:CaiB/BaiF CoA transferase family protein [Amycolatopsis alkalitolerans]|uniref:CoA transferase n=1 Tax=Amycolatopsis alkalitolerans TaxID=2547244 RepID=A0A5C4M7N0_9PSEU|nr:CaiB/BaiF CoA-transferase family protein [Amycolatopsis alkalitolerans]TNC29457.1 CoA transferase [Amycolatopsis alkalitolerans]